MRQLFMINAMILFSLLSAYWSVCTATRRDDQTAPAARRRRRKGV